MWWQMFLVYFYFLVLKILDFSILHSKFKERKEPGKTDDYRISINISIIRFLQSFVSAACLVSTTSFFVTGSDHAVELGAGWESDLAKNPDNICTLPPAN